MENCDTANNEKKDGECWLPDSRPSVLPAVQIVTEMSSMNESIKKYKIGKGIRE